MRMERSSSHEEVSAILGGNGRARMLPRLVLRSEEEEEEEGARGGSGGDAGRLPAPVLLLMKAGTSADALCRTRGRSIVCAPTEGRAFDNDDDDDGAGY